MAKRRAQGRQQFARTDRIAEVLREVIATELERIGDERLDLVTVTGVIVANDFAAARVFYSSMLAEASAGPDVVVEALEEVRWRVQQVVNRSVSTRKTPQIEFVADDVLTTAMRIEDILAGRVETGVGTYDVAAPPSEQGDPAADVDGSLEPGAESSASADDDNHA